LKLILCQITSYPPRDRYAIQLDDKDFAKGSLNWKEEQNADST